MDEVYAGKSAAAGMARERPMTGRESAESMIASFAKSFFPSIDPGRRAVEHCPHSAHARSRGAG